MSPSVYPIILAAQVKSGIRMKLIYSADEQSQFYLQFQQTNSKIWHLPCFQSWFRERLSILNEQRMQFLRSEGFAIGDTSVSSDISDCQFERSFVLRRAESRFSSEYKMKNWLNKKNKALNDARPKDLMGTLTGLRQVNNLLMDMQVDAD